MNLTDLRHQAKARRIPKYYEMSVAQLKAALGITDKPAATRPTAKTGTLKPAQLASAIAARTGKQPEAIMAALKQAAVGAIAQKRAEATKQGTQPTKADLIEAAKAGMTAHARTLMGKDASHTITNRHIKPHADPRSADGMQERVKREQSIGALKKQLAAGRFKILGTDAGRVSNGKATALEALSEATDPKMGLFSAHNAKGEPIGFMSYKPGRSSQSKMEIQTLGSDQSQKGAGKNLFHQLLQEASRQGKGIIVSATDDAVGFYQKMGMKQVGHGGGDFELSAADVKAAIQNRKEGTLSRRTAQA